MVMKPTILRSWRRVSSSRALPAFEAAREKTSHLPKRTTIRGFIAWFWADVQKNGQDNCFLEDVGGL